MQAYDDIEGKIDIPASLRVVQWKRPSDFITEKVCVLIRYCLEFIWAVVCSTGTCMTGYYVFKSATLCI